MYKLLLVDDERIVRYGITNLIPWNEHEIEIIEAVNGIDAMEKIRKHEPDFIFTDIKMPGMNGLKLIEWVKTEYPSLIIVILSGYNEFEYAKKAMSFRVKYYLLKPADEKEIMDIIHKLIDKKKELENKEKILNHLKQEAPSLFEECKTCNDTVNIMLKTIDKNIDNESLSLTWLANEVLFMNIDYLGKLFKQEMKTSFTQYCMKERMEKAKALLLMNDSLKISVIAKKVGYGHNPQYFSQVFKKFTGFTPKEYKKQKGCC